MSGGNPNYKYNYTDYPNYSLPSVNVNPREWIKVNIYTGVNS